jgi:hypothetical protein
MTASTGLSQVQRVGPRIQITLFENIMIAMTRPTVHFLDLGLLFGGGMETSLELLLGVIVTGCTIRFSQFLSMREILDLF